MKNALLIAAGLAVAAGGASLAHAETYQWKDASGRTIISDTPPPGHVKKQQTGPNYNYPPGMTTPAAKDKGADAGKAAPAAPKTAAEQEMEFKKRQLEAKEKADKEAKEQQVAAAKRENCERAKRAVNTLEKAPLVGGYNEKGERVIMGQAERQAEIERARNAQNEYCQ